MITERAVRRQIRATTNAMTGAYDIDAIVRDVQDRHGLVDIDTIGAAELHQIISGHDITQQVKADAARRLQEARDCLAAERAADADERRALADRFHGAMIGLVGLGILGEDPDAGPDENFDAVMAQWSRAGNAPADSDRADAVAALTSLFVKLDARIQAVGTN